MTPDWKSRIALFLLVWFSCAWFGSWELNPNQATRMFAAISLVEDHDATIDEYADATIDKASFDGHVYLDKAPGMTLMALPAVAIADAVTGERATPFTKTLYDPGFARFMRLRTRLAVATGPALLTALATVLLYDIALVLTASSAAALFAALGYALGTPAWGWSTTLLGHAPVAALYVIAIWAILHGTPDASTNVSGGPATRPRLAALAGFALGWAVVIEHQAVIAGSVIALWAVWRLRNRADRWPSIASAVAAGSVALLVLAGYNMVAFGTPFRVGYQGVVGFEGMDQGLFGLVAPNPAVFATLLIGFNRGFVWVAPILILAPFGLFLLAERRPTRALGVMAALVVLTVLLVNAAYVYWDGGNSTGPRHAMPLAGVLAIGLAPAWMTLRHRALRVAAGALLMLSIALNAIIATAEIFSPPDFRFPVWSAVIEHRFLRGDLHTIGSEYWGWSTWTGFALWGAVAIPVIAWLAIRIRKRSTDMTAPLRIAFLLFPNVTQLDLTGPAQVLSRLGNARLDLVWKTLDPVPTDAGFSILPTATFAEVPHADILCVPGGVGINDVIADDGVMTWIQTVGGGATWVTSVCTGSLILGAAGLLDGYRAGCHWAQRNMLTLFGAIPVDARTVVDRNRVTGGGVTAGIDFALTLTAMIRGEAHAKAVQLSLEYDPAPPFDSGSPAKADPDILAAVTRRTAQLAPTRDDDLRALAKRRGYPRDAVTLATLRGDA